MIGWFGTAMPKKHPGLPNKKDVCDGIETMPKDAQKRAHFCSMCGPKFRSMQTTQDVRDYTAEHGMEAFVAIDEGMAEKAAEFREHGGDICRPA